MKNILFLFVFLWASLPLKAASVAGDTIADEVLIYDTLPMLYATVLIAAQQSECRDFDILNTEFIHHNLNLQNNKYIGEWYEKWTVKACGDNYLVPITFIQNQTGTTFMFSPKDVIKQ